MQGTRTAPTFYVKPLWLALSNLHYGVAVRFQRDLQWYAARGVNIAVRNV